MIMIIIIIITIILIVSLRVPFYLGTISLVVLAERSCLVTVARSKYE